MQIEKCNQLIDHKQNPRERVYAKSSLMKTGSVGAIKENACMK
jgi:hypothetical protein